VPVHGEYRHLKAQANLARELGMDKENIFILRSGDVLELSEDSAAVTGKVPVGSVFVDGLGVGDVGNIVLRDRQHLAEDGILIVVVALDCENNIVVSGPDIVSRGFVYVRESDALLDEAKSIVSDVLDACASRNVTDWGRMKNNIKDALNEYFWKKTRRRPMILPIIMEV
jgi:ribonuclease J